MGLLCPGVRSHIASFLLYLWVEEHRFHLLMGEEEVLADCGMRNIIVITFGKYSLLYT